MHGRVASTQVLTPSLVRVVLEGGDLAELVMPDATDAYINAAFRPADAPYGEVFDPQTVKESHPDAEQPARRRYTVRSWDAEARRLTVDFVVHGDTGVAGPWAAGAVAGDEIELAGPGGAYAPDPQADWHLLAGDASVIPAISASLPAIPAGVPVYVVVEVDSPAEEQPLSTPGDLRLQWVHRSAGPGEEPELLAEAVAALALPEGRGQAFVHGEASSVRALRRHLIAERGLEPEQLSISGYWKLKRTEEGWREDKAEWNRLVAADVAAAA